MNLGCIPDESPLVGVESSYEVGQDCGKLVCEKFFFIWNGKDR